MTFDLYPMPDIVQNMTGRRRACHPTGGLRPPRFRALTSRKQYGFYRPIIGRVVRNVAVIAPQKPQATRAWA